MYTFRYRFTHTYNLQSTKQSSISSNNILTWDSIGAVAVVPCTNHRTKRAMAQRHNIVEEQVLESKRSLASFFHPSLLPLLFSFMFSQLRSFQPHIFPARLPKVYTNTHHAVRQQQSSSSLHPCYLSLWFLLVETTNNRTHTCIDLVVPTQIKHVFIPKSLNKCFTALNE